MFFLCWICFFRYLFLDVYCWISVSEFIFFSKLCWISFFWILSFGSQAVDVVFGCFFGSRFLLDRIFVILRFGLQFLILCLDHSFYFTILLLFDIFFGYGVIYFDLWILFVELSLFRSYCFGFIFLDLDFWMSIF